MKKEIFYDLLIQIFGTKTGWLAVTCILVVVFGSLSDHSTFFNGYHWCWIAMLICLAYPFVFSLIMIGYGIKNTFFKGSKND